MICKRVTTVSQGHGSDVHYKNEKLSGTPVRLRGLMDKAPDF